jgi:1,4-alpha-glucan branching enzyme
LSAFVSDLNQLYRAEESLHALDFNSAGFEWTVSDGHNSVVGFTRRGASSSDLMLVVVNATPVPRANYRLGVRRGSVWTEMLNSDDHAYGGSGVSNGTSVNAHEASHGQFPFSLTLTLPPLSVIFLKSPGIRL